MSTLYLELYQGQIPQKFRGLPGFGNHNPQDTSLYWCVLTAAFPAGSAEATALAPEGPTANAQAVSHGTDAMPAGTSVFPVSAAAVWNPKYPPYRFRVIAPDDTVVVLDPPTGSDDTVWHSVAMALNDGKGIWVVKVELVQAGGTPQSIDARRAHLNPAEPDFTVAEFYKQPLLRLEVGAEGGSCPEITRLRVVEGCAPGQVRLLAETTGNVADIEEVQWDYGDGASDTFATGQFGDPIETTHDYGAVPAGPARLTILRPQGCSPRILDAEATIPPCGRCPTLDPLEVRSGCAPGAVTIRVRITGDRALASQLTVNWGDGQIQTVTGAQIQASQDFTHTYNSVPGGQFVVTLDRVDLCDPHVVTVETPVPTCPTNECPELRGIIVEGCAGDGAVTFTADVTNPGLVEQYAWDFGDGQTTTGGQSVSHTYSERRGFTATVTIRRPARCTPREDSVANSVPSCERPRTEPTDFCVMLFILMAMMIIAAVLMIFVAACGPTPYTITIAVILAAVAIGLVIAWLIFCGASMCRFLNWLLMILGVLMLMMPILSIVLRFIMPCLLLGGLLNSAYLGVINSVLFFGALFLGCIQPGNGRAAARNVRAARFVQQSSVTAVRNPHCPGCGK